MKTKCIHCEHVYALDQNNKCPSCGKQGGYLQEPKLKKIGDLDIHLEDVLIHTKSANEYQVKEIQSSGIVAVIIRTIFPHLTGKRAYISNVNINEYEVK